ncbi:hypothetical protein CcCBS67573_g06553 [Chytriomyces confervae]|uniref:DUF647 domain-containing protein n=1 Tax=Chytriomyces confervae TaxID=246404 RepID=A0A507F474_9FUNG|nr:hypothetical protein HDU80_011650 [Chytriomyces hyalinus]TPX70465.1 hypothetical protein CcCBS67573_g06553 [Chytriomyces confervae]
MTHFRIISSKQSRNGGSGAINFLREAFLPVGYPDSVSADYTVYQAFDSLQAFCSNLSGVLAARAAFRRAGVGDASATATAATLTWIMQDGTGMIGRILYAWRVSFLLDADCKQWRFYADILNDSALSIEVLSPVLLPKSWFAFAACLSTLLKSLCGVTGGATKAALSQHFAIRDNMADLHAKEGSQETVVGLVGMILGSSLMYMIPDDSTLATLMAFVVFTSLHLICNYEGIRAVVMPSLNTQRAFLVLRAYMEEETNLKDDASIVTPRSILSPAQVSRIECIFWKLDYYSGSLWTRTSGFMVHPPKIELGSSLDRVLDAWGGKDAVSEKSWQELRQSFSNGLSQQRTRIAHFLAISSSVSGHHTILVALQQNATQTEILLAYYHSLLLQYRVVQMIGHTGHKNDLLDSEWCRSMVKRSCSEFSQTYESLLEGLDHNGWELDSVHQSRIYIHSSCRFALDE